MPAALLSSLLPMLCIMCTRSDSPSCQALRHATGSTQLSLGFQHTLGETQLRSISFECAAAGSHFFQRTLKHPQCPQHLVQSPCYQHCASVHMYAQIIQSLGNFPQNGSSLGWRNRELLSGNRPYPRVGVTAGPNLRFNCCALGMDFQCFLLYFGTKIFLLAQLGSGVGF